MRDPAPSATAGGAFVFTGSARTSTYHIPVLADTVRAWAEGSRRAVDATVGGGGHAALLRAALALPLTSLHIPARRSAAGGRFANLVRAGRQQPQRIPFRVAVRSPPFPNLTCVRGLPNPRAGRSTREGYGRVAPRFRDFVDSLCVAEPTEFNHRVL